MGKAARAAAKEARWVLPLTLTRTRTLTPTLILTPAPTLTLTRWVLLGAALAQRGAPEVGERVQGKYQVQQI